MTLAACRPMTLGAAASILFLAAPAFAQSSTPALDVHFVPTPQEVVDRLLTMAKVGKEDFVIDLGSGDGRIVITAAQKFGARGMGVDLDPQRIQDANTNRKKAGVEDRVEFRQANLFETDLSKATVLTMYLLPRLNIQLRPLLLDLKPGTRIASHAFDMGEWRPDRHDKVNGRDAYFWVVPAKVAGRWRIEDGKDTIEIELSQQYQEIQGTARIGESATVLQETNLRGDEIRFVVELPSGQTRAYRGKVTANRIEPLPAVGGASAAEVAVGWKGSRGS
jgi:SAM-dependent methyltransferase